MSKENPEMTVEEVVAVVELFDHNNIQVILDGGWGVDALLGRQTRAHRDLDVAVLHKDVPIIRSLLAERGYREVPQADTWECNFVLGDGQGHLLDIHSCTFDEDGNNIFGVKYPLDSWGGTGSVKGVSVRCITPGWMVQFHSGYELDENDFQDVRLLCERFGIPLPPEFEKFIVDNE